MVFKVSPETNLKRTTLLQMMESGKTAEDSLTYVTAELQYMLGNYKEAAAGLATYITRYCNGGRYCTNAH